MSCSRREQRSLTQLAVLPFENLSGDATLDSAGAAVAGIFAIELSASTKIAVRRMTTARDAMLGGAGQIMRGYFEKRGGQLRFFASVEDEVTHQTVQRFEASGTALHTIADSLARQTGERLRPFSTQNPDAIRAWGESIDSADPAVHTAALKRAILADPNFGTAYADLAQLAVGVGQRDEASQVIAEAKPRLSMFNDVDRARVELAEAELQNNPEQRRRALVALSRLVTTDSGPLRRLAEIDLQRRDYASAAEFYKNALALRPDDVELLNALGYAEAYRGNLEGSRSPLERYRALQPDQPNPLDSLGETSYFQGRFEDAEKYFLQAQAMSPGFLGGLEFAKAAQARLMKGDLKGADDFYMRFVGPMDAAHPLNPVRFAQWQYLTGRKSEARDLAAKASGPVLPYAAAQLTIWTLAAGEMDAAKTAAATCITGGNPTLAAVCRALIDPNVQIQGPMAEVIGVYRTLAKRDFKAALPELKKLYERSDPSSDVEIRTLYAWALTETGAAREAANLVEMYPLFQHSGGDMLLTPFVFPRFLAVRAAVRQAQGKSDEAAKLLTLYRQYAGESAAR